MITIPTISRPYQKVSASEAKNRLGALLAAVTQKHRDVVVESRGEPKVVIISYRQYETFQSLREEKQRQNALLRLDKLRERVARKNKDITEKKADKLADRLIRETIAAMTREGKIKFKST